MGGCADLRVPMGTHWHLWGPLGTHWHLWGPLGAYGHLWGPLEINWHLCGPIGDLSGPMWTYGVGGISFLHPHLDTNPAPPSSKHRIYIRHITHLVVYTTKTTCHIRQQTSDIRLYTLSCCPPSLILVYTEHTHTHTHTHTGPSYTPVGKNTTLPAVQGCVLPDDEEMEDSPAGAPAAEEDESIL